MNYLDVIEADQYSAKRKRALLISLLGQEDQRIVATFNMAGPAVNENVTEFDVLLTVISLLVRTWSLSRKSLSVVSRRPVKAYWISLERCSTSDSFVTTVTFLTIESRRCF